MDTEKTTFEGEEIDVGRKRHPNLENPEIGGQVDRMLEMYDLALEEVYYLNVLKVFRAIAGGRPCTDEKGALAGVISQSDLLWLEGAGQGNITNEDCEYVLRNFLDIADDVPIDQIVAQYEACIADVCARYAEREAAEYGGDFNLLSETINCLELISDDLGQERNLHFLSPQSISLMDFVRQFARTASGVRRKVSSNGEMYRRLEEEPLKDLIFSRVRIFTITDGQTGLKIYLYKRFDNGRYDFFYAEIGEEQLIKDHFEQSDRESLRESISMRARLASCLNA